MTRALVMGDIDLVRPLALAGIRSALFALPGDPARRSRHVDEALPWIDHWAQPGAVVDAIRAWAGRGNDVPVLYPQTDGDLLALSRHRDRLDDVARHCLADAELIETLVDKDRFTALAHEAALPVPPTRRLAAADTPVADVGIQFPVVAKPLTRRADLWRPLGRGSKAVHAADGRELRALWQQAAERGVDLLVQEAVPGHERRIESYHAYIDSAGDVAAEFTGRKIRTWPVEYGMSTAVEITDAPDVAALGRDVLARIGLRGVAKADFKRAPDGTLLLFEINPRFTLWHHPAALAGCNVPALVHADLTGERRPPVRRARSGVRWCQPRDDRWAAAEEGVSTLRWIGFVLRCRAISGFALRDPLPLLHELAHRGG